MFKNIYKNKKVLITGNTGFKGSWLTTWLLKLGAEVTGISIDIPTKPSMFEILDLENKIDHHFIDITNLEDLKKIFLNYKPDFIFHLAAQAIVSSSYTNPLKTLNTNIIGTANILDVIKDFHHECTAIFITSDKCYDNVEWVWGYRENDNLGGKDIYSGSKGAAELVIKSYFHSFIKNKHNLRIAVGRAGNVIGGGDWANDRIIVDCIKSWINNEKVEIRSPKATRPWQHVLEPLSGYLKLGEVVSNNLNLNGEAFNFGPKSEQNHTVINLITELAFKWGFENPQNSYSITDNIPFHEAGLLKLNCDKALYFLGWNPTLNYNQTINFVSDWYNGHYNERKNMYELTLNQISNYENKLLNE